MSDTWCSNCGGTLLSKPRLLAPPAHKVKYKHTMYRTESSLLNHMADDVTLKNPHTHLPHMGKADPRQLHGTHTAIASHGFGSLPGVLQSPSSSHVSSRTIKKALSRRPPSSIL
eukprot:Sspe_Gene.14246::Locus_4921_Transcript_1_2_Confidence_0.500_Length_1167::g.14246::m.14246